MIAYVPTAPPSTPPKIATSRPPISLPIAAPAAPPSPPPMAASSVELSAAAAAVTRINARKTRAFFISGALVITGTRLPTQHRSTASNLQWTAPHSWPNGQRHRSMRCAGLFGIRNDSITEGSTVFSITNRGGHFAVRRMVIGGTSSCLRATSPHSIEKDGQPPNNRPSPRLMASAASPIPFLTCCTGDPFGSGAAAPCSILAQVLPESPRSPRATIAAGG